MKIIGYDSAVKKDAREKGQKETLHIELDIHLFMKRKQLCIFKNKWLILSHVNLPDLERKYPIRVVSAFISLEKDRKAPGNLLRTEALW